MRVLGRTFILMILLLAAAPRAHAGGILTSGQTTSGSLSGPTFVDGWSFSGAAGQHIVACAVTTSGLVNTTMTLRAPGGGIVYGPSASDRMDVVLAATGTYTLDIGDSGANDAGTYAITLVNLTVGPLTSVADTDGGAVASASIVTGSGNVGDIDAFTFTGTLNDRILFNGIETGGAGYNTNLYLYAPDGSSVTSTSGNNQIDFKLTATGTWTVLVEDIGLDTPGTYSVSFLNVTAGPLSSGLDADGGAIASNESKTGTFSTGVDMDAFTFSGNSGESVLLSARATGAGSHNTQVNLYPPGGGPAVIVTASDRNEVTLTASGTWTLVLFDNGLNDAGAYALTFLNINAGPLTSIGDTDGGPLASTEIRTGSSVVGDFDAFTFTGTLNDRILFNGIETGGAGYNTTLFLFGPTGVSILNTSGNNQIDFKLTATGTWTVVVEDIGDDTPGTYSVSFLNMTAGPTSSVADPDGGPIASNEIKTGTFSDGVDMDVFTFSGNSGETVLLSARATGVGSHNTQLNLYPPGGGSAIIVTASDRNEVTLTASGTWTLVLFDNGLNDAGAYALSFLNINAGPLTSVGDTDGGPLASTEVRSGTSVAGDFDAFTFTGTLNDRILFNGIETGGVGYNTNLYLFGPSGISVTTSSGNNQFDFKLTATGTWTVVVEDIGDDTPGTYSVSFLNMTAGPTSSVADPDGGPIASNEIKTGSFSDGVDMDVFTFSGNSGETVLLSARATGVGSHNTQLNLYPPGGGSAIIVTASDRNEVTLTASGTWTLVLFDNGLNDPGAYALSFLNINAGPLTSVGDTDGGPLASAEVRSGTSVAGDFDAFTFTGTLNDRILFNGIETGGVGYNTNLYLFGPSGISVTTSSGNNQFDFKLTATGTWTVVVEDIGDDTPGNYSVSLLNMTAGPTSSVADPDGGAISSNDIKAGTFSTGVDMDVYTFIGTAGQTVLFTALATGGGGHNTQVNLYPPGGGAATLVTASDRNEVVLTATGAWTIVMFDNGLNDAGGYLLSFLNVSAGAFTSGADTGGGAIISNDIRNSTTDSPGDFDGYQFLGSKGDRVVISAAATAGAGYNTTIYLFPPAGTSATNSSGNDRLDFQLNATGAWTIVIESVGNVTTGSYNLCFLNATGGPLSSGGSDGGIIETGVPLNGSIGQVADLDGYTFFGNSGETANITCVTTLGAMNTQVALYPPGGGPAVILTAADVVNQLLSATGYYTIVVEDNGEDQTGNYTLTLNGTGAVSGTPPEPGLLPDGRRALLLPASPSPFRQNTLMAFRLGAEATVELRVYNAAGQLVRTLVSATRPAGRHEVAWDGRDDEGQSVGSGVYYLRLRAAGEDLKQKVVRVL